MVQAARWDLSLSTATDGLLSSPPLPSLHLYICIYISHARARKTCLTWSKALDHRFLRCHSSSSSSRRRRCLRRWAGICRRRTRCHPVGWRGPQRQLQARSRLRCCRHHRAARGPVPSLPSGSCASYRSSITLRARRRRGGDVTPAAAATLRRHAAAEVATFL